MSRESQLPDEVMPARPVFPGFAARRARRTSGFAMAAIAFPGPPALATRPARRILLVEDDANALEVLSELLEAGGDEVSVSCTGAAALALARLVRPDVVVMDLRLPDTDGVDLIRALKAVDASMTIVVFSGSLEAEPAARAAGGDWFVLKPDSDTLKHVLGLREPKQ